MTGALIGAPMNVMNSGEPVAYVARSFTHVLIFFEILSVHDTAIPAR
jgi:hypothetical protein